LCCNYSHVHSGSGRELSRTLDGKLDALEYSNRNSRITAQKPSEGPEIISLRRFEVVNQ